jgi:hypothetical protein
MSTEQTEQGAAHPPERVYFDYSPARDIKEYHQDVTFSRANDADVEYVRGDLYTAVVAELCEAMRIIAGQPEDRPEGI